MFLFEKGVFLVSCMMWLITVRVSHHWDIAQLITNVSDVHSYNTRSSHSKNTGIQEPFFLNNSMLAYREWYVAHTNQIAASGYVSFRASFCSLVWEVLKFQRSTGGIRGERFAKWNHLLEWEMLAFLCF